MTHKPSHYRCPKEVSYGMRHWKLLIGDRQLEWGRHSLCTIRTIAVYAAKKVSFMLVANLMHPHPPNAPQKFQVAILSIHSLDKLHWLQGDLLLINKHRIGPSVPLLPDCSRCVCLSDAGGSLWWPIFQLCWASMWISADRKRDLPSFKTKSTINLLVCLSFHNDSIVGIGDSAVSLEFMWAE